MQTAHVGQKEKSTKSPRPPRGRKVGGAGVGSKLCHPQGWVEGNCVVSFENKSSGNQCFTGQPGVFSVGWCPCFRTLVAQGGRGGAGRGRGLWDWERVQLVMGNVDSLGTSNNLWRTFSPGCKMSISIFCLLRSSIPCPKGKKS